MAIVCYNIFMPKRHLRKPSNNEVWHSPDYYPIPVSLRRARDWTLPLKWFGYVIFVAGALLNALNIYPLNAVFMMGGGFVWAAVGWLNRDWPLLALNISLNGIYIAGLIWNYS